jgi:uncharacterized damage-inducible protein DinB
MIEFSVERSLAVLERTPFVIEMLLRDLPEEWTKNNEGEATWSPYDIVGHLIHGDKTDWIPRMNIILSDSTSKTFEPFDRFAQFEASRSKSLSELMVEFKLRRKANIEILRSLTLSDEHLMKTGIHPTFGSVTLRQLLATWTAHDLNHIGQIVRVMAKQYSEEVGPWKEYLGVLKE